MAASAKGSVFGLADGVVVDSDPSPVVDCVAEAWMGGKAAHDDPELAGSPCDGRYAAQTPQRLAVPGAPVRAEPRRAAWRGRSGRLRAVAPKAARGPTTALHWRGQPERGGAGELEPAIAELLRASSIRVARRATSRATAEACHVAQEPEEVVAQEPEEVKTCYLNQ